MSVIKAYFWEEDISLLSKPSWKDAIKNSPIKGQKIL